MAELLVGLALLALMSLLLVQGMAVAAHSWQKVAEKDAAFETVLAAQTVLRHRMEAIYPATRYDARVPYADFDGNDGSLEFLAPPPDKSGPGALRRYILRVNTAGDLVLVSNSDLWRNLGGTALQFIQVETLLHGVQSLDALYLDAGQGGRWRTMWHGMPRPPSLVRLQVNFAPGDRRSWPELIIRPLATIDTECVYSPQTQTCGGR